MTEEAEPFLRVKRDAEHPELVFATWQDIVRFFDDQEKFWSFLDTYAQAGVDELHDFVKSRTDQIAQIRGGITATEGGNDNRNTVRKQIGRLFGPAGRLPTDNDPVAHWLAGAHTRLSETAFLVALKAALSDGSVSGINLHNKDHFEGLFQFYAFKLGLSPNASQSERSALATLRSDQGEKFSRDQKKFANDQKTAVSDHEKLMQKISDQYENRNMLLDEAENQLNVLLSKARGELSALENTYNEKLKLEAPTTYWRDKRRRHRLYSIIVGPVCVIFAILAAWFLVSEANALHAIFVEMGNESRNVAVAEYLIIASKGIVLALILFWVARILVRLFLSEIHLSMDAHERETMVMTYLALTKDGPLGDQERALVLQPLFRPTADGIVKDDASSDPTIAALVGRAISGKS